MVTCHEMFMLCHMQYCDITEDSNCKVFINKSVKKEFGKINDCILSDVFLFGRCSTVT